MQYHLTKTLPFQLFSTHFFNFPLEKFNNARESHAVTPFLASHRRNQQFERTLVTEGLRGCCGRGVLQLERCLDGDLSRNEAAPGCISERRELAPLRVAVPVFHGTPHAFPQPSRPHSDVCCPAGVSWHHERRRKRSPPSLHPPFTRSPFSFTRPHPNHPVHPVSLPFTLSRVYIIHAVHQHPLPHRFAIARHANTIEPQTLKSSPNPTMAIPPPMTPSKV